MELNLATLSGAENSVNSIELADSVFSKDFNESLIHQIVTACLAGARQNTRGFKNRAAVSGGGAKPWRQKGTGRARAGTSRSPIWRSGGKTFAGQTANYKQKVNRKMYRAAMRSMVSELIRQDRLMVLENFVLDAPKTKLLASRLAELSLDNVLIVTENFDESLHLASRNLVNVDYIAVSDLDPVLLIEHEKVLMTLPAIKKCEEILG